MNSSRQKSQSRCQCSFTPAYLIFTGPYSTHPMDPVGLKLSPSLRSVIDTGKEHRWNEKENKAKSPPSQWYCVFLPWLLSVVQETDKRWHQPITDLMESWSQDRYQESIVNIIDKLITNQRVSHLREKQTVMKKTIVRSS